MEDKAISGYWVTGTSSFTGKRATAGVGSVYLLIEGLTRAIWLTIV